MSPIPFEERLALVLDEAVRILKPRGAWTKGGLAYDEDHRPVITSSPNATCWCALGALDRAQYNLMPKFGQEYTWGLAISVTKILEDSLGNTALEMWNDKSSRRKKHVIDLFTRAAKDIREEIAR